MDPLVQPHALMRFFEVCVGTLNFEVQGLGDSSEMGHRVHAGQEAENSLILCVILGSFFLLSEPHQLLPLSNRSGRVLLGLAYILTAEGAILPSVGLRDCGCAPQSKFGGSAFFMWLRPPCPLSCQWPF